MLVDLVHTVLLPDQTRASHTQGRLRLIASTTGDGFGYQTGDYTAIQGTIYQRPNSTGKFTFTDLAPNLGASVDVITDPPDTRYGFTVWQRLDGEWVQQGPEVVVKIDEHNGATQYLVDCIDPLPADPDFRPPVAARNVSVVGGALPGSPTNVQSALENMVPNAPGGMGLGQYALRDFYTALDDADTTVVRAVIVGDSIATLAAYSLALNIYLAARHTSYAPGEGYIPINGDAINQWSAPGGTLITAAGGPDGYKTRLTAGQYAEHAGVLKSTALTVVYDQLVGAGSIEVRCDGVLVGTINANGATSKSKLWTSPVQTDAIHTWRVTVTGATTDVHGGFFHRNNTAAGIQIWGFVHPGFRCVDFTDASTDLASIAADLDPGLTVIALGTNDASGTLAADMTALVAQMRTAHPATCVDLVVPYEGGTCSLADVKTVRALTATLGTGSTDFQASIGGVNAANDAYDLSDDEVHPNQTGFDAAVDTVLASVSGDPLHALGAMLLRQRSLLGNLFWKGVSGKARLGPANALFPYAAWQVYKAADVGVAAAEPELIGAGSDLAAIFNAYVGLTGLVGPFIGFSRGGVAGYPDAWWCSPTAGTIASKADVTTKSLAVEGLTGSTNQARIVGRTSSPGAPATGAHVVGDIAVDSTGVMWVCTGAGTPGTWSTVAGATVDTDGTLSANSDTRIASQKATKTYVDQIVAANDAMVFKGSTDCSANPNYPAADRGHTYRVAVAGKIGGASGVVVEAGDLYICLTDGTSAGNQATVGTSWTVVQTNQDGAVIGPASATDLRVAVFSGPSGKLIADGGTVLSDLQTSAAAASTYATKAATHNLVDAAGDLLVGSADNTLARLAVGGSKGMSPVVDDSANAISWGYGPSLRDAYSGAAGVPWETVPRLGSTLANTAVLSSGRISMVAIMLPKGVVISTIGFVSATTAAGTPTNQWFFIADDQRVVKKFTSNDTTTAWAANTPKVLNLTSTHTTTYAGWHYLGIMVTATTVPTLAAVSTLTSITGLGIGAKLSGTADTGLTTVPGLPFTAAAMTAAANIPYAICY